jgi:hypothetical protein
VRPRTLLILAVVVGALLALIYFAEDKVASTDERAAAAKRLVDVQPDEVTSLTIDWQGARVRFERVVASPAAKPETPARPEAPGSPSARPSGSWRIVEPIAQRADSAAVSQLVATLVALEATRQLDGAARADVGLEPARGTVSWTTAGGDGRLEVGGAVPASHDVVVAASGRTAPAVTSDSFVAELSRPAGEWRSREVVVAARDRIETVTIQGAAGAPPVVLTKSGEGLRLASPVTDIADRDLVERLLSDLEALRMETFLDPPLSPEVEQALAARSGSIEVAIAGEAGPQRIEVGGETAAGKRVWRSGAQTFESSSPLAATVVRPAGDWRSRSWTRFENWRIEKARIEAPAGSFELVRSDGEWLRDGGKIPFTAASDLLYALTSARAESLDEGGATPASAGAPRLTVTLSDADGNEERLTLLAGVSGAATVPARTSGREVSLLLPGRVVEELEAKVAAVRSATPLESPAAAQDVPAGPSDPAAPGREAIGPSPG